MVRSICSFLGAIAKPLLYWRPGYNIMIWKRRTRWFGWLGAEKFMFIILL